MRTIQIESLSNNYKTLRTIVLDKIREMILNQELKPGQKIQQDDIAQGLGVSRMPVREALGTLEMAGLVISAPHRGVIVSNLSIADIEELTLIRCTLEGIAVRLGAEQMDNGRLESIRKCLDQMAEWDEGDRGVARERVETHKAFHFTIYEASGLPRLYRIIVPLWEASERYRRECASLPGRRKEAFQEHAQLMEACVKRDGGLAEEVLAQHLRSTSKTVIEHLRRQKT